ncbi:MFS transporter [Microbacterium sp. NPDC091313]
MQQMPPRRKAPNSWWVAFVCGMAMFVDGAATAGVGTALVLSQSVDGGPGLSPNDIGVLTAVLTAGVAIGSLLGGRLADRFGRRSVFLITMAMVVVGAATPFLGLSFATLLPGVLLIGLGVGADLPVAATTTAEAATDRNRGKLLTLSYLLSVLGTVMTIAISVLYGNLGPVGAQIMFGAFAVVGVIVFLLRLTIPESQVWLDARADLAAAEAARPSSVVRLRSFLERPYRRPFFTLLAFYALTAMAISISTTFGAYVAVNVAGIPVSEYSGWTIAALPTVIVGTICFSAVVDTRFRMKIFVGAAILNVCSTLIPVIFGFNLTTIVTAFIVGAFTGCFCYETIMRVWAQESFPAMLRSTAQGTVYAVGRFAVAGLAIFTPALLALSATWMFVGVSIVAFVGFGIGWLGFRRKVANQFDVEAREADETSTVEAPQPA